MIPAILYCDNQSARYIVSNPILHETNQTYKDRLSHRNRETTSESFSSSKPLEPKPFNDIINKLDYHKYP